MRYQPSIKRSTVFMVNGTHKTLHTWYDGEDTTIEEIFENLDNAIKIVLEHNNSLRTLRQ
ncbi:MAG: hypothetical protein AB9836_02665 [Aminipila sp.]